MNSELTTFAIVFPLLGLLIAVVCQLAGSGRLKRNAFVGIRLPSVMASDEAWRAGHRAVVQLAWFAFFAMFIVAILAFVIGTPATISAGAGVIIVVLIVDLLLAVLLATRAARRADNR